MTIKLTTLAALLYALMSTSAFAHTGFKGNLGAAAGSKDIILFKCSTLAGTSLASVSPRDEVLVNAAPNIKAQMYSANSTACLAAGPTSGTTAAEGGWGTRSGYLAASPGSYYCIHVTKTAAGADDYQLNHHCERFANDAGHGVSTFIKYVQDQ